MTVSGRARLSEPFHRETLNSPHHRSKPKAGAEPKTIHLENGTLHPDRLSCGADDRLKAEDLRSSDVGGGGPAARRFKASWGAEAGRIGSRPPRRPPDALIKMAGFWQNRFDHLEDLLKR